MATQCRGCNRNLSSPKKRFDWLVSRGYSQKDAAAIVLHNPANVAPVKSCCIVSLETNYDTDKTIHDREIIKGEILREDEEMRAQRGEAPIQREIAKFSARDRTGNIIGRFILKDSILENPEMLAASAADRVAGGGNGFKITNIANISQRSADEEGWPQGQTPVALWFGSMKLVPVVQDGMLDKPGVIYVHTAANPAGYPLYEVDKSFLQAEVLEYELRDNPQGANLLPAHVLTVKKQFPRDIIA